jgi:urease accessory protein
MTETARLLEQRSVGDVRLHVGRGGVTQLRESGALKVRVPRGSDEAILINTGGGIAGGDDFSIAVGLDENTPLTVTSQAAERVYRTLGPAATINVSIVAGPGASLRWLPLETILFDGASLRRSFTVQLSEGARFLAVEPLVLGRKEMGETVGRIQFHDDWRVWRGSHLAHAEAFSFGPSPPWSSASLAEAGAIGTIMYFSDDAMSRLDAVRNSLGPLSGASAWNGKLIARLLAEDGFILRKQIISALHALAGAAALPKIWTM